MGAFVSANGSDVSNLINVPVIAAFNSKGKVHPLYVRIQNDSYQILEYYSAKTYMNVEEFHCQVQSGRYKKALTLLYFKTEDIWAMRLS